MARTKLRTLQLPVTTSVGGTGVDTAVPSEKAVRTAITGIDFTTVFVDNEAPTGDKDGENCDFVLANIPDADCEEVFLNGILQNQALSNDYTIVDDTITFNDPPEAGDVVLVNYHYTP